MRSLCTTVLATVFAAQASLSVADVISAPSPVQSLEGLTVILGGVDVTAFARITNGTITLDAPIAVGTSARLMLLDDEGRVLAQIDQPNRTQTEFSGTITHTGGSDQNSNTDGVIDLGLDATRDDWNARVETRVAGGSHAPVDPQTAQIALERQTRRGALSFHLGDQTSPLRSTLLGQSLRGRGIGLRYESERFSFGAAVLSSDSPTGYRDVDLALNSGAYRIGLSSEWKRSRATYGMQAFAWADEKTGERGTAFGLSLAYEPDDRPFRYALDLATSKSKLSGTTLSGWAIAHALSADWSLGTTDISFQIYHDRATEGFKAPETNWAADVETIGLDTNFVWDTVSLDLSFSQTRDNLEGRVDRLTTIADSAEVNLTWSLDGTKWRPQELSLFAGYDRLRAGNAAAYLAATNAFREDIPDAVEKRIGLSAAWSHAWGETAVEISRGHFDERAFGRSAEDWKDTSFSFGHRFEGSTWALSLGLDASRLDEVDPSWNSSVWDTGYSIGLELFGKSKPQVSIDYSRSQSRETIRAFHQNTKRTSEQLSLSADFTSLLTARGAPDSLRATAFASIDRYSDTSSGTKTEPSFGFQISFSF